MAAGGPEMLLENSPAGPQLEGTGPPRGPQLPLEVKMNPLTRYEPLAGQLDNLFNDFFRPAFVWDNRTTAEVGRLRVDVKETGEAYQVDAEIPGVKRED